MLKVWMVGIKSNGHEPNISFGKEQTIFYGWLSPNHIRKTD